LDCSQQLAADTAAPMLGAHEDPLQKSDGRRFASVHMVSAQGGFGEGAEPSPIIFLQEGDVLPVGSCENRRYFITVFVEGRILPKLGTQVGPGFDIRRVGDPYRHFSSLPAVPNIRNMASAVAT